MAENDRFESGTFVVESSGKMADNEAQSKLIELQDTGFYENVFSWDMRKASMNTNASNIEFRCMDEILKSLEQHLQMMTHNNDLGKFDLHW